MKDADQIAAEVRKLIREKFHKHVEPSDAELEAIIQSAIDKAYKQGRIDQATDHAILVKGISEATRAAHASEVVCITCGAIKQPNWTGECSECEQKAIQRFSAAHASEQETTTKKEGDNT